MGEHLNFSSKVLSMLKNIPWLINLYYLQHNMVYSLFVLGFGNEQMSLRVFAIPHVTYPGSKGGRDLAYGHWLAHQSSHS